MNVPRSVDMQYVTQPQQFSLPLQRRFETEPRPQTVHASFPSSAFSFRGFSFQPETIRQEPLPGLGVLPEAAERRLSREDTGTDVRVQLNNLEATRSEEQLASVTPVGWQDDASILEIREQRQQRRSVFKLPNNFSVPEGRVLRGQTASLGRRFSRTFKDNMSRYTTTTKARRASTPTGIEASAHAPKFSGIPVAPTSPSKRNGKYESERPAKLNRHFHKPSERKDTPAPPFASSRPATSHLTFPLTGGDMARQAAAASKLSPLFQETLWSDPAANPFSSGASRLSPISQESIWSDRTAYDLEDRRTRVGSLSSAADSGADLSSYSGSNSLRDADGDVNMTNALSEQKLDPATILPDELFIEILEFLDAEELLVAEMVSKTWRSFATKPYVWRSAFLRKYERRVHADPPSILVGGAGQGRLNKPDQQWKRMYKARTLLDRNWRKGPTGAGKAVYLAGHTDSVYCVQFDEEKIITGSRDRTIRVWDINNFTCQRVIGGPNVRPTAGPKVLRTVDYPDFHLATASVNGTTYGNGIYEVPSEWHDASILCLQYDEKILVTGSSDSDLIVWDIKTYHPIARLRRHTGGVLDVALDAKHIVSCSKDSRIIVWSREDYRARGELTGHRGPVNAVQMRGNKLVSASGDGIARLWDLDKLQLIKEFPAKERGLAAVEFSEDGKFVLAGGNDTVTYKFDVETGEEVMQFTGHSQLVRSLWLDSQNSRVVSGSYDLDLRVYDFNTGEEIWRAEEWTTSWMLAAKSDYRRIVATSQDGRILIVDFGLKKLRTPDDGQPIDGVDLLRGTDSCTAIEWRDPWEATRQRDRASLRARIALNNAQRPIDTSGVR